MVSFPELSDAEEGSMKVGIIGVGAVGAATAMAVAMRARAREMVLIDRDQARAKAVATDMHYGEPLSALLEIRDGDYDDLADAGVVVITAGINEKAGGATDRKDPAGRLRLLDANVKVYRGYRAEGGEGGADGADPGGDRSAGAADRCRPASRRP